MNVKELKEFLKDIDDDFEVVICIDNIDSYFYELGIENEHIKLNKERNKVVISA